MDIKKAYKILGRRRKQVIIDDLTVRAETLKEVRRQVKLARKAGNRKLKRMFVKLSCQPVLLEGIEQGLNNLYAEILKRLEKMEQ